MEKLVGYLIVIAIVAYITFLVISAVVAIGVIIVLAMSVAGIFSGAFFAIRNFALTVGEAGTKVARAAPIVPAGKKPLFVPQPSYLLYPFDRGWRTITFVRETLFARTKDAAQVWLRQATALRANIASQPNTGWWGLVIKFFKWCAVIGLGVAGGAQYAAAMIIAAITLAFQVLLLTIWAGITYAFIGVFQGFNALYSRYYRIFRRCPVCYEQMPVPSFICPTCAKEHTRLWPSIYGVFQHSCECKTKLSTFDQFGRAKLLRICHACRHPLTMAIGAATNVHIPIVGGPSTGKTNYIVMATHEFIDSYAPAHSYTVSFPEQTHQQEYEANLQRLNSGRELAKTSAEEPQAYNLLIKAPNRRVAKIAYIYDAAGEVYGTAQKTELQRYYSYIDGIILVIDPFAIPAFRAQHVSAINQMRGTLRPSDMNVQGVYERMIETMEAFLSQGATTRFSQPLAVVVTKVDALQLEQQIGTPAARAFMAADPTCPDEGSAISLLVQRFLQTNGMGGLLNNIGLRFKHVKYFSCSALGRLPGSAIGIPFVPVRVADPLLWLMENVHAIEPEKIANPAAIKITTGVPVPVTTTANR